MVNLKELNENQLKAVLHKDGPCAVIAGAGSGKTKVLTYRIGKLIENGVNPQNILAITYTKKAADEMKTRLKKILNTEGDKVKVATIHALCYLILRIEDQSFLKRKLILDWQQKKIIENIIKNIAINISVPEILTLISFQKNSLLKPFDKFAFNKSGSLKRKLNEIYKKYEYEKSLQNLIDFDDMLMLAYYLLKSSPEMQNRYKNLFKYILLDEAQDTNNAQYKIIRLILNSENNIFIVGDVKQSIYEFRGANINLMMDFQKNFKNSSIITLNINYRSSKNIVNFSNELINSGTIKYTGNPVACKSKGKKAEINKLLDEYQEASEISKKIESVVRTKKYGYNDIAILYRTNFYSANIENSLVKFGIPYVIIGGQNFLERKEIKDLTAYLKIIYNNEDNDSLMRVINVPNRFLGKAYQENLTKYAIEKNISYFKAISKYSESTSWRYTNGTKEILNIIQKLSKKKSESPSNLLTKLIKEINYIEYLKNDGGEETKNEREDNVKTFINMASRFKSLQEFLVYINNIVTKAADNSKKIDKVQLLTVHKSKGLEFPVVFVAGVNDNMFPHYKTENIEEELRILYVAVTRAMDELHISYPLSHNGKEQNKSRFLKKIDY